MKNFLIALFLLSNFSVFAQNPDANTEAYLTYGSNLLPFNNDENTRTSFLTDFNEIDGLLGTQTFSGIFLASTGSFTIGYNIRKGNHVIGGLATHQRILLTYKIDAAGAQVPWSDVNFSDWTLAGRYHYNWINKDKLKMYSGLSAGAGIRNTKTEYFYLDENRVEFSEVVNDFYTEENNEFILHLHANAIGLRYGTDWALILELGIGSRGFVNVGINHHLFASEKWAK